MIDLCASPKKRGACVAKTRKLSILRSLEAMAGEQKNCLHKARLADKVFFATATERGGVGEESFKPSHSRTSFRFRALSLPLHRPRKAIYIDRPILS